MSMLVAHRIFDEVRLVVFDQPARAHGIVVVEALMEVDAPVAVLADAFARFLAIHSYLAHPFVRVVNATHRGIARAHAECAISGFHGGTRPLPEAQARTSARTRTLAP